MKLKPFIVSIFSIALVLLTVYLAAADVTIPAQSWSGDTSSTINLSQYFPQGCTNYQVSLFPNNIAVTINQLTTVATLTPAQYFSGVRTVQFSAQNATNVSEIFYSNNVTLTVTPVPHSPYFTSNPPTTIEPNRLYQYQVAASDPDNNPLVYALVTAPSGMTMSTSGLISFTPTTETTYPVNISVTDGTYTIYQAYTLTVKKANKLVIDNIKAIIDGKSESSLTDGDRISKEAVPGSTVKFEIKVANLFTRDEDLRINDVEILVTISNIDDGDDLDDTGENFDLSADRTKTQSFSFDVPKQVDEGTYDVIVDVEGRDENGTYHKDSATITLEVQKERHDLRITRADITPETVTCQKSAALRVEVTNQGSEDEDRVAVEVIGGQFGYHQQDTLIELYSGTDSDSTFAKTYTISTANLPEGVYTLEVRTYYDDTILEDVKTLTLTVDKCTLPSGSSSSSSGGSSSSSSSGGSSSGSEDTGLQVTYINTQPGYTPQTGSSSGGAVAKEESSLFSSGTLIPALIIVGIIIILLLVIYIIKLLIVR